MGCNCGRLCPISSLLLIEKENNTMENKIILNQEQIEGLKALVNHLDK